MPKETIKSQVINSKEELVQLETHSELRDWAIKKGFDNRSAFPKFKEALKEIGINYEQLRSGKQQDDHKTLVNKITHSVTLFVDAKASYDRFGITDEDGKVLWHGIIFDEDYNHEQSRAELCAAKKAVWLASKIKEAINVDAIELKLMVDAQWLTYQDHSGQKGYMLTQLAKRYNINLLVEWIPGTQNPSDVWTTAKGVKKWQENNLAELAKEIKVAIE